MHIKSLIGIVSLSLLTGMRRPATDHTPRPTESLAGEELLARSAAIYAGLQSYADAGTVAYEYPGVIDRFRFKTFFRRESHDLYFDYQGISSYTTAVRFTNDLTGIRLVIWMANGDLQKFVQETRTVDRYPREGGNQPSALNGSGYSTKGTSTLILSMLYTKARLLSTMQEIEEIHLDGEEEVGGRKCHRLVGVAASQYATGRRINARPVTLWLDAETLLIRKLFEGTPQGSPLDSYRRLTITLDPQANPKLDDSKFQFTVPSFQKQ